MAPCVWCGAGSAPQRCARCGQAWYCSKECQKSHWRQEYGGHPTHKAWCVPEADFAGTVQGFVEQCDGSVEDMEWLDSPVLRYNDRVYDAVCSARVHDTLRKHMLDVAELATAAPADWDAVCFTLNWCRCAPNCLFNGTRVRVPKGCAAADDRRVLAFLASDAARAWPAWISALRSGLSAHLRQSVVACRLANGCPPIQSELRDLLAMTTYALAHANVAAVVLEHHAAATWSALGDALSSCWDAEATGRSRDTGAVLEGYVNCLANVLREHALRERGAPWADEHLSLAALGFSSADDDPDRPFANEAEKQAGKRKAMFQSIGCATARAHIEHRGSPQGDAVDRHMRQIFTEHEKETKAARRRAARAPK